MSNTRKWQNCELNKVFAEKFKVFLKEKGIKYEASGADYLIHFECFVNDEEAEMCDKFIMKEFVTI